MLDIRATASDLVQAELVGQGLQAEVQSPRWAFLSSSTATSRSTKVAVVEASNEHRGSSAPFAQVALQRLPESGSLKRPGGQVGPAEGALDVILAVEGVLDPAKHTDGEYTPANTGSQMS